MCRYKVDAGSRSTVIIFIKIRASGKPKCKFTEHAFSTTPIITNAIAVLTIPFHPSRRKFSNLVTTFSNVPGFGNQFYLRDHRVLVNDVEERTKPVYFMQLSGQCCCQVKA